MDAASPNHHYAGLDIARGWCAILIVIFHTDFLTGQQFLPLAYLAVDFFFLMSGFVIGVAYDAKLRPCGFVWTFLKRRFARLAPMWWLGLALGAGVAAASNRTAAGIFEIMVQAATSLFFIPNPFDHNLFPLDPPGWSLFYEAVANIGYAVIAVRLSNRLLAFLVVAAGLVLIAVGWQHGALGGTYWDGFLVSLTRVTFSFSTGLLVYRLRDKHVGSGVRSRLPIVAVLTALLILFAFQAGASHDLAVALGAIVFLLPLMLLIALQGDQRANRFSTAMGNLSYPLYTIHMGVFALAWHLWRALHRDTPLLPLAVVAGVVGVTILMSLYLGLRIDPAAQRWLRRPDLTRANG